MIPPEREVSLTRDVAEKLAKSQMPKSDKTYRKFDKNCYRKDR